MRPLSLLAPALLLLLPACQPDTSTQVATSCHYGAVSFSCPAGWKTDAADYVDSTACTVSCEKAGFGSSGLVSMSWFADSLLDQQELQGTFRQQLRGNPVYKTASIHFEPVQAGSYGSQPAQVGRFTFSLLGVAHAGAIYTFAQRDKTFAILAQQALEDSAANRPGLQVLAASLRVQPSGSAARTQP